MLQTTIDVLFFNKTIKEAIDFPRFHHQLLPDYIQYEKSFPLEILQLLKTKGHEVKINTQKTVVESIQRFKGNWYANCDFRKDSKSSGL